jgi:hypothetical protein
VIVVVVAVAVAVAVVVVVVVVVRAPCRDNLTWSRMYRKLNCARINGLGLATG